MTASPQDISAGRNRGWMSAAHACAAGPETDPSSCPLCQGAAQVHVLSLQDLCCPSLLSSGIASISLLLQEQVSNQLLLALPTAHREVSPQLPMPLKPHQQLLRHCSSTAWHMSGTSTRGKHAGRKLWQRGHELGQVLITSQQ